MINYDTCWDAYGAHCTCRREGNEMVLLVLRPLMSSPVRLHVTSSCDDASEHIIAAAMYHWTYDGGPFPHPISSRTGALAHRML